MPPPLTTNPVEILKTTQLLQDPNKVLVESLLIVQYAFVHLQLQNIETILYIIIMFSQTVAW